MPVIPILAGVWVFWGFGYNTLWQFLVIDANGVIIASIDRPYKGAPRDATEYTIRTDGGDEIQYIAGPTDGSLERGLPVGTTLRKIRWELGYEVNGRWVSFPRVFYAATLGAALVAIGYGIWTFPAWYRWYSASR